MIVEIANTPRDYAWGSTTAIADLQGRAPSGRPEAELWLGTHPGSPARLVGRPGTLLEVTGEPLPFLLKVLAAASPLSLQVHPDPDQAERGFAREDAAGIPIDDPRRNYRDRSAKPEMVYALGPFRALVGFRPVAESRADLAPYADDPEVAALVHRLTDDSALADVVAGIVRREPGVDALVRALVTAADVALAQRPGPGPRWARDVALLARRYPGDPGIAIAPLMNSVELGAGEALALSAGVLHSYLEGTAVELMAASDNVVRGGLTSKHVDVDELLALLSFRTGPVAALVPERAGPGVRVFRSPDADLALTVVECAAGTPVAVPVATASIAIVLAGRLEIDDGSGSRVLQRGAAAYVSPSVMLRVGGTGVVAIASGGDLRGAASPR